MIGGAYPCASMVLGARHEQAWFKGGGSLVVLSIRRDVIERGGTSKLGLVGLVGVELTAR